MSVSGKRGVGIPVILLHDAEGGVITIEMKNGSIVRGLLEESQDNMNCTLKVFLSEVVCFVIKFCCQQNVFACDNRLYSK